MTGRPVEGIAVVGMGCRFPGADGPAAFWRLLRDGVDAVTEVPAERWDADALYDPDLGTPGTASTRWGGFVSGLWEMDASFFDVSPREAAAMDPQQRLLLAVAWEALEHAAIPSEELAGGDGGVFLGVGPNEYAATGFGDLARVNAYFAAGNATCMAVNRVSGFLDLRGPSLAVDSGCSSSLLAVHLACQALRAGECSVALAGGVNAVLSPQAAVGLSQAWMTAADGRCKSFDAAADGYVRSEGCGVVVLKRLAHALRDGDRIMAVVLGSAVNQDGRGAGLTVPSPAAQAGVVRRALERSGVEPDGVDYVEAHGVGTPASDRAEAEALAAVFGGPRDGGPCLVGSVKTNVGHLEPAAGIAALVKTVLALEHGEVPPHLHFRELPEEVRAAGFPLRIPLERTPWPRAGRPRRAGINSFGLGGTNVHLVVEEAPALPPPVAVHDMAGEKRLLLLSARTEAALRALAGRWAERLQGAGAAELRDLCHTAAAGRTHFSHRLALVSASAGGISAALREFAAGGDPEGVLYGEAPEACTEPGALPGTLDGLAQAYLRGARIPGVSVVPGRRVDAPTYPFQTRCYRVGPEAGAGAASPAASPRVQAGPLARRPAEVVSWVRGEVAEVLGTEPDALDPAAGLFSLGLTSLMAVDLHNRLQAAAGRSLPVTLAFDHPTIERLAGALAREVPGPAAPRPEHAPAARLAPDGLEQLLARVESLPEEAARALLPLKMSP